MANDYQPNGGQTYMPFHKNTQIETQPYTPLTPPNPPYAPLELNPMALEKKWVIAQQAQHFLPGVTSEMLDWFWANMEKGYYLWGPGSHKRFSWVKAPWEYGFNNSAHMISESVSKGAAVFGGSGIQINRLGLDYFPFTTALPHVLVEGIFNDLGEFVDMTVHMWTDCPGGCNHVTAAVASTTITAPPHFVMEMLAENPDLKVVPPSATDHCEYEASRWPQFLPQLFSIWKDHPDPSQNVACDLTVKQTDTYTWEYVYENGPVVI